MSILLLLEKSIQVKQSVKKNIQVTSKEITFSSGFQNVSAVAKGVVCGAVRKKIKRWHYGLKKIFPWFLGLSKFGIGLHEASNCFGLFQWHLIFCLTVSL